MSGIPTDPGEMDMLAGEYVIGTLDSRASRAVEAAIPATPELARMVAYWETRLAPLSSLAVPEAPPPDLWPRIERIVTPAQAAQDSSTRPAPSGSRFLRLWQGWAIGASLAAAALAAVTLVPRAPETRMMTVLLSDASQTAWTAEVDRSGGLHLAALSSAAGTPLNTAPEGGKTLQLWALAPGATVPVSLGLVPRGSGLVNIGNPSVRPVQGMMILISLEPPGGAPGALPTGPVLFQGRLTEAGPAT